MVSSKEDKKLEKATFALACFWSPDAQFGCFSGVLRTRVGYCGGKDLNPKYLRLGDHTETVDIDFDPLITSYENLLNLFWLNHDPTLCKKRQYMSIIFYHNEEQKRIAEESKVQREKELQVPIITKILPFETFYEAEDYHQKYMLQAYHPELFRSLNLSHDELITSTIAAKLNGYVAGYGNLEAFDAESQLLGLSPENVEYVRKQINSAKPSAIMPLIRTVANMIYNYFLSFFRG